MDRAELLHLAADNRRHAARLFRELTPDQWNAKSLCAEWTVRDVAGHFLVPLTLSTPRIVLGILRHGGSFDAWNAKASKQLARQPTEQLISALDERAESNFVPPGFGAETPVCDTAIHLRDFARPLGLPDGSPPVSTWRIALDFLVTPKALKAFSHKGLLDGIEVRATDQDWQHGAGSRVEGASEALALAISGRGAVLDELSGDGVATLRTRLRR
jgi:uncharacterized protein (TIGR03083 family)